MANVKIKNVSSYLDRYGKRRWRFRKNGKTIQLPAPDAENFPALLAKARCDCEAIGAKPKVRKKIVTFDDLFAVYFASEEFRSLAASTRRNYRLHIRHFSELHGFRPVATVSASTLKRSLEPFSDRPSVIRHVYQRIYRVMDIAIMEGVRLDNPMHAFTVKEAHTDGHMPWPQALIDQYREAHASGTKARLVFELLLGFGVRRGDIVKLSRSNLHVSERKITYIQSKTGTSVTVPIMEELYREINQIPSGQYMLIVSDYGKPISAKGFGNWFAKRRRLAGIPKGYAAHGLRKSCAIRLAEAGCTAHEIAAVTGHQTLKEVERYTRKFNRGSAADKAFEKMRIQGGT